MKRVFLFLVVFLILGWSCTKKKYPESFSENAPIFFFKAKINNAIVEYNAGLNNYRVFSSYIKDSNDVYNLIAELKQKDCQNNCANSIKIQINDYKISSTGTSIFIDSALRIGSYSYLNNIVGSSYTVAFNSESNKDAVNYRWDFGDGTISNQANPVHVYTNSGKYQVCLQVKAKNGYESSICNTINLQSSLALNASINVNKHIGDSISFVSNVSGGKLPYSSYRWDFGDGSFSNAVTPIHNYAVTGSYPVSLMVTDANGETIKVNYNAITANDLSSFAINYSPLIMKSQKNAIATSKIIIYYTDENGKLFSSLNLNQSNTSKFEIMEIENFEPNELNQSTKKLKIKFNCTLYNGNQSLSMNDAETVIAVSYK